VIGRFGCDIIGNIVKYAGCKLEHNYEEHWVKFTQLVLLQSYNNGFELGTKKAPNTPADPEQALMPCKEENGLL
jgi:hypothetical protein